MQTAIFTLAGGVTLLIISELLKTLIIIPLKEYNKQVQKVFSTIDYWSNRLCSHFSEKPNKEEQESINEMRKEIRKLATNLNSCYTTISFRNILIKLGLIPSPENISIAYNGLIYLHNSVLYEGQIDKYNNTKINRNKMKEVFKSLFIKSSL